jgi:hypothetical protein
LQSNNEPPKPRSNETSINSAEFRKSAIGELKDWVAKGHVKLAPGNTITTRPPNVQSNDESIKPSEQNSTAPLLDTPANRMLAELRRHHELGVKMPGISFGVRPPGVRIRTPAVKVKQPKIVERVSTAPEPAARKRPSAPTLTESERAQMEYAVFESNLKMGLGIAAGVAVLVLLYAIVRFIHWAWETPLWGN